ncbi:hypothetical protein [Tolumonas osonensis]|uniref:Uncharacterized protein n=1 Tax=Tolumonas osonensis TaxID=675874 RepID=A0A841GLJ0_9GAMM|nr:hypothetical protein [Tolumonas osonensis]MBB6056155.1 hypothetical protein [Tolumonas osonensis]
MKRKYVLYTMVVIILCFSFLFFSPFLAKKYGKQLFWDESPDNKYHIETLKVASFYLGELRMDTPGFVRAYDKNGKLFYESEIVDLYDNCQVSWPAPEVGLPNIMVGMDVSIPISP